MTSKTKPNTNPSIDQGMLKTIVLVLLIAWSTLLIWKTMTTFKLEPDWFALFFDLKRFGSFDSALFINHWLSTAKVLLMLLGMLLTAYGIGSWLGKKLGLVGVETYGTLKAGINDRTSLRDLMFSFAVGFAAMSLLTFFLGVAQLYYNWIFILLTVIGALVGGYQLWLQRQQFNFIKSFKSIPLDVFDYSLIGLTFLVLFIVAIITNAPELYFDSLVYHLAVPQKYLLNNGIKAIPNIFFSNFPFGIDMLYLWGLSIADERLCKMLHAVFGLLTGFTIYVLALKYVSPKYALWSLLLFLSIPVININMMQSGIELGTAFFTVVAFNLLLDWFEKNSKNNNIIQNKGTFVVGMSLGMALIAKYTVAFILAPATMLSFLFLLKQYPLKNLIKPFLVMSIGVFVILFPLFFKNIVITNNPVYPFLYKIIPSKNIHPEKMHNQMIEFKEKYGKQTFGKYIKMPWDLSFHFPPDGSFIGSVLLLLLPGILILAIIKRRGPPEWQLLYWSVFIGVLIWSVQTKIIRYSIPILPMVSVLIAIFIEGCSRWHKLFGYVLRTIIIVLSIWGGLIFWNLCMQHMDPVGVSAGRENRHHYIDRKLLSSYISTAMIVNELPVSSKTLIVGDTRSYYYTRETISASPFDHHPLIQLLENNQTAEQIWKYLKQNNITHLFIHHGEALRIRGYEPFEWTTEAVKTYQELITYFMKPVYIQKKQQVLYEIVDEPMFNLSVKKGRPVFTEPFKTTKKVKQLIEKANIAKGPYQIILTWREIQQVVPDWWLPYQIMASQYYKLKQYDIAFNMYIQAESLGWLDAIGYTILGDGYARRGKYQLAKKYFHEALKQEPDYIIAKQGLEQISRLLK